MKTTVSRVTELSGQRRLRTAVAARLCLVSAGDVLVLCLAVVLLGVSSLSAHAASPDGAVAASSSYGSSIQTSPATEQIRRCPRDSVPAGVACVDKYEASIWQTTNKNLIRKIKKGTVTREELIAGGAVQRGVTSDDFDPGCPDSGAGCKDFYAVSIKGVRPSSFFNWFQAVAAARNSEKRLPTNAEWQAAALGTPDGSVGDDGSTTCHVGSGPTTVPTGSRSNCVSDVGAFDMVGNVVEWVAEWAPRSTVCGSWSPFSDNDQCLTGAATDGPPGTLIRGGSFDQGAFAGPFYVNGATEPNAVSSGKIGFRAAR